MLNLKQMLVGVLAAAFVAGSFAGSAWAQAITNPNALGAALAAPYLTTTSGGDRITVHTVTNASTTTAFTLHVTWLSGDPDDEWAALDFDCPLTPLETTYFVYENNGNGTANVTFECSNLGQGFPNPSATNNVFTRQIPGQDGIAFVALECQLGSAGCPAGAFGMRTRGANVLVGDATVLDFAQGLAFSVEAIHFQGAAVDGDRLYRFDGAEYLSFPSLLATNFIAPDDDITAELILFTLDGKANDGFGGVFAKLSGVAFDDDENPTSGAIEYDCFDVVDITNPPNKGFGSNVTRQVSGGLVGHLELFASSVVANDVHDADPLTGGIASLGARKRPSHGWLVQTIATNGQLNNGNSPPSVNPMMAGAAAWARTLNQGTFPFTPLAGDTPSLMAGPPPF